MNYISMTQKELTDLDSNLAISGNSLKAAAFARAKHSNHQEGLTRFKHSYNIGSFFIAAL